MSIIGRKKEQDVLYACVDSKRPEFLVVYGRRRIGKTFLIKEFFHDKFSFYATGVPNAKTKEQLKYFHNALRRCGAKEQSQPKDWLDAFERLRELLEEEGVYRLPGSGKRVVFLDELPWMDTPRSDFKTALDYFWNSFGSSQKDLLLIVCGSATSWIIEHILTDTGGLYNRITRRMHLSPFSLLECKIFFRAESEDISDSQILDFYMIFGGVPYYLNLFDKRLSVAQNVDNLIFDENGALHSEYYILFHTLFRNAEKYETVIMAMAKRKSGMTRGELLMEKNVIQGNSLTCALRELAECRFIRKYRDYSKNKQGHVYQIVDPFVLFCINFVKEDRQVTWQSYVGSPGYYSWRGNAFEILCLNHLPQIKEALGIAGVESAAYAWRSKKTQPGVQIDLLVDRRDDVIDICEMKYSDGEYVIDTEYEKQLVNKRRIFREETGTKKTLQLVIVSAEGLKKNAGAESVTHTITVAELFR